MHAPTETVQVLLEDTSVVITGIAVEDPDFLLFPEGLATYSRDLGHNFTLTEVLHPYNNNNTNGTYTKTGAHYPFTKLYNSWNVSAYRSQQSGLLRVKIESVHGNFMFSDTRGLRFLLNASISQTDVSPEISNFAAPSVHEGMCSMYFACLVAHSHIHAHPNANKLLYFSIRPLDERSTTVVVEERDYRRWFV